ncbi:hypothetical protein [Gottfriedia solisilvae]|uniref:Uncharacterized protein n=1 Tax=Gottfriedia solisilvae TaxID=1516104 RepID=A0A8J3ALG4_9BACI|nr:hypothetical protein [Gottfriedia solisilvae]GGI12881.1 hypothetical protein GCM10007380_15130 [Gottfriedia solisilvae]
MNYKKVAWCPICDQGWVEIVKDVETNELFVMCDEYENEWNQPSEVKSFTTRTENNANRVTTPTDEEIKSVSWEKYIIKN